MSSSSNILFASLPILSGVNYKNWAAQMKPYLMLQGVFCIISGKEDEDSDTYNAHNKKAIRTLILKMAPILHQKWQNIENTKDIWEGLKNQFSIPSLAIVYGEFKKLMDSQIPASNHPAPTFASINNHFALLREYNYPIDEQMQVMIVMAKLPPYMDVMTQLLNQKSLESTREVEIDETITMMTGKGKAVVSSVRQLDQAAGVRCQKLFCYATEHTNIPGVRCQKLKSTDIGLAGSMDGATNNHT
jgi:hypothetical protein